MSDECNKKRQSLGLINLSLQNQPTESTLLATVSNVSANLSSLSNNAQCSNCGWTKLSECDEFIGPKRSKHTIVAYGNLLYVFGGDNGKQMLNDLITYDCQNNSWSRALNGFSPTPRYHHTACVYNQSMFVFGGYTGDLNSNSNLCNKNDLYEYKFSSGTWHLWHTESNAPVPRSAHAAIVYDNKLWIFAGYDGNARLNDMWNINLNSAHNATKTWVEVEQYGDQPPTVNNFPLTVCGDAMYLFSGHSGTKSSNQLFKFEFKTSNWSIISSNYILRGTSYPPSKRSGHIMVAYENHLYIYGGVLGNNFFHDIYSFDLETKTWNLIETKSVIPSGYSFLAATVHNEYLYVFGGNGDQNTRSNELYRFKLPNEPPSTFKDDLYKILKKEFLCDLKFICTDNQIVLAHSAIVASRSSSFRQLIKLNKNKMKKSLPDDSLVNRMPPFYLSSDELIEIKLIDEKIDAMKIVLEYLYTDRILSLEGKENENDALKLIIEVYKISNQFMIHLLKKMCENLIEMSLSCKNVLCLLRYTDNLNLISLKDLCMKFLAKDSNFNQIIMQSEFEQIETALMVEIIRLRQNPQKTMTSDKLNNVVFEKCNSLEKDLENFLKKEIGNEFADIFINVNENGPPLLAHRCILAARCAYFEAFFRSFMPKDRRILMTIGDAVPPRSACLSLLRYIYYDDITMPPQDALYLFSASHYFQFSNLRLHVFCKQNLEANVSKNNVFDILEAADRIQEKDMKEFALKIVRNNFPELAHSNRIKKLPKELLLDIIEDISNLFIKITNSGNGNNISNSLNTTSKNHSSSSGNFSHYQQQQPLGSHHNYSSEDLIQKYKYTD